MSISTRFLAAVLNTPILGRLMAGWMITSPEMTKLFQKATFYGVQDMLNRYAEQCQEKYANILPAMQVFYTPVLLRSTHIVTGQETFQLAIKLQVVDTVHVRQYFCAYVIENKSDPFVVTFDDHEHPQTIGPLSFFSVDELGVTFIHRYESRELQGLLAHMVSQMRLSDAS